MVIFRRLTLNHCPAGTENDLAFAWSVCTSVGKSTASSRLDIPKMTMDSAKNGRWIKLKRCPKHSVLTQFLQKKHYDYIYIFICFRLGADFSI